MTKLQEDNLVNLQERISSCLFALALVFSFTVGDGESQAIPILVGKATFYGLPAHLFEGNYTRGGDLWDPEAMTCAVSVSNWNRYRRERLLVCSGVRCVACLVNDSGYLARKGVAVDLTPAVFRRLGRLEDGVLQVRVYVMGGDT